MEQLANHYRERTVALLAFAHNPSGASGLADYGPPQEGESLRGRIERLSASAGKGSGPTLHEELRGLQVAEDVVILHEMHPAWLAGVLESESPRVVGLLMRYLPSRHVRYLAEHLPEGLRRRLPHLLDTFAVTPTILRLVRRTFESHFVPIRPTRSAESLDFSDLAQLRGEELEALLRDLGIHELAIAFRDLPAAALHIVFNRLKFRDAKALRERILAQTAPDPLLERDAKYTIFECGVTGGDPEAVLTEIGVHALAKALSIEAEAVAEVLRQKLVPSIGYLLRRCLSGAARRTHPAVARQRQAVVRARLAALASAGAVAPEWKQIPESLKVPVGPVAETLSGTPAQSAADNGPEDVVV
ncbi:MAG: hypothetical protein HYV03_06775 [Deltaproteobacteria bacterium]|nr:hypothetical protein [Deltaproteobacteria bacterium]